MSFTPKSILFNVGMFLLTLVGSLYIVGLIVPGRGISADFESRFERRGHREEDRMMREELESLRELNMGLEKKMAELEQRLDPADGLRGAPMREAVPAAPTERPLAPAIERPRLEGDEKGTVREF